MRRKTRRIILILAGVMLILGALGLSGYNLWLEAQTARHTRQVIQELKLQDTQRVPETLPAETLPGVTEPDTPDATVSTQPSTEPEVPAYVQDPWMDMPERQVEGVAYIGYLEIPSAELYLPVIAETSTELLKIAPCRYSGSAYLDDMVIGAHNMEGLFRGIGALEAGTQVFFTDMDGNMFIYAVESAQQLRSNQVEELICGDWDLTLYTCTYTGSARIVVRCQRISQG